MTELGSAFADALRRMLKKKRLSVASAAQRLGVSRQQFHSYLNGVLPRRKRLNKAMHLFELRLDLEGQSFYKGAFPQEARGKPVVEPGQLKLFDILDSLGEDDLQVSVKRTGTTLKVQVRIDLPA